RYSRGDNSQHAGMPPACRDHNCRIFYRIKRPTDMLLCGKEHLFFNLLPLAILFIKRISEGSRFALVFCKKKPQRLFGRAEPPRCVQTRPEPKTNIFCENWRPNSAELDQFAQTKPC